VIASISVVVAIGVVVYIHVTSPPSSAAPSQQELLGQETVVPQIEVTVIEPQVEECQEPEQVLPPPCMSTDAEVMVPHDPPAATVDSGSITVANIEHHGARRSPFTIYV
jgi:hypothetical protein